MNSFVSSVYNFLHSRVASVVVASGMGALRCVNKIVNNAPQSKETCEESSESD